MQLRPYPADVLAKLKQVSSEVVGEIAKKDAFSQKVYDSYQKFLQESEEYSKLSELAYLQARDQG